MSYINIRWMRMKSHLFNLFFSLYWRWLFCYFLPSFNPLQESISDFYWYYSGKDVIDEQGQRNFSKAINVAKQVFNTLTEYIQVWRKLHQSLNHLLFAKVSFKRWSDCALTLRSTDAFIYMLLMHTFSLVKGCFLKCLSSIVNHDIDYTVIFNNISGSLHWKSAKFGPQSTMGCCGGLLARLRSHADEIVTGVLESH